jgi:acyl carrier protein
MLSREQIRKTLIEIIETDMGADFSHVQDTMKLRDELGLDSVDIVSVVSQIERRFRIRLTHQELEKLTTVGDVLDLLHAKLASSPSADAA